MQLFVLLKGFINLSVPGFLNVGRKILLIYRHVINLAPRSLNLSAAIGFNVAVFGVLF